MKKNKKSIQTILSSLAQKGAFHVFIGNFISKFVAFFASMFIVRLFSKSDYGTLGYVENLFGYVYLFAGLGLTNALFRYIVLAKDLQERNNIFSYVVKRGTIYNIVLVTIFALVFVFIYPHKEEYEQAKILLPIALVSIPFQYLTDSEIVFYRATFESKKYAYISCAIAISVLLSKYLFAWIGGLIGAFTSNILIYMIWSILLFREIRERYLGNGIAQPLLKSTRSEINFYSAQYMITNSIWTIFMLNDIFILGQFGNSTMLADYKVASALPANLSLFSSSIGVFVAPYFVKNEKNTVWVRRNYLKILGISALIIGGAGIILGVGARPILSMLYGQEYVNAASLMQILVVASVINNVIRYTGANLLAAMGQIKANMLISILGVVLQIGINLVIAPRYGAYGIAYTSVIVYMVMALVVTLVFYRKFFRKEGGKG